MKSLLCTLAIVICVTANAHVYNLDGKHFQTDRTVIQYNGHYVYQDTLEAVVVGDTAVVKERPYCSQCQLYTLNRFGESVRKTTCSDGHCGLNNYAGREQVILDGKLVYRDTWQPVGNDH